MKVVIAGGSGFVGRGLIDALLDEGNQVVLLSRSATSSLNVSQVIKWDPAASLIEGDLNGTDVLINLAGENIASGRWTKARKKRFWHSRINSVKLLNQVLAKTERKPRLVIQASATGFYGDQRDRECDESAPAGSGFLADLCQAWEKEAESFEAHQIPLVILRLGMVLGRDGGALAKMLPLFKMGLGSRLGDGKQWMSWIHKDDVVRLIMFLMDEKSPRGAINAVSPNPVTNREFTRTLAKSVRRPSFLPVPAMALRMVLGELSHIALDSQRVKPQVCLEHSFEFRFPKLSDALSDLV